MSRGTPGTWTSLERTSLEGTSVSIRNEANETQAQKRRTEILNWLSPDNYAREQYTLQLSYQVGTGQWLLNSAEFGTWMDESQKTLFCTGDPGAGKTMFTSLVVDTLTKRFAGDPHVVVAYIYCDFRKIYEQTTVALLASLLEQITRKMPTVPKSVERLYDQNKLRNTRPKAYELLDALYSVAPNYSRIFIIIDAIDELNNSSDSDWRRFLSFLIKFQGKSGASLFVTSRPAPRITEYFQGCIRLDILAEGRDQDIRIYVEKRLSDEQSGLLAEDEELRHEAIDYIAKNALGVFLNAQLLIEEIKQMPTKRRLRDALSRKPRALEELYDDAMDRIERQPKHQRKLAIQVFSWITSTMRGLTAFELQHALSVETGASELDEDNFIDVLDMVSVCAGLVQIDPESNAVRVVHYSVYEYLQRKRDILFPHAHTEISDICVTYLSFEVFASGFCLSDEEFEQRVQSHKFYKYAAQNWGNHSRIAGRISKYMSFLESAPKVEASAQALMIPEPPYRGYSQRFPRHITSLHLAAYFGLEGVVDTLISRGSQQDAVDSYNRTPLSYAAENGHSEVTRRFAFTMAEVNSKDTRGRTPLLYAARSGKEAVVNILLETGNVDADSTDIERRSPLSWAAEGGYEGIVWVLLEGGVEPSRRDKYGRTPLSWAAQGGHITSVELLVNEAGKSTAAADNFHQTPLWWAARYGHAGVVKLLLTDEAVYLNLQDIQHKGTPLWWAVNDGHEEVVKLLLETPGVEVEMADIEGRSPLSRAAQKGHELVTKLLLDSGRVDWEYRDKLHGRTALSWAAQRGHLAVVRLLLQAGAEADSKDTKYGQTPLSWASLSGRKDVVHLLLYQYHGVDPVSKDLYNRTPLSHASQHGHVGVVSKLLGAHTVDLESKDSHFGRSPLLWAVESGQESLVELLLDHHDHTPDVNCRDKCGRTALSLAAENGYESIAMLLLARGAEVESKDNNGRTPLSWAAGNGHTTTFELLLRKGGNPDSEDEEHCRTPLLWASESGSDGVAMLLLKLGAKLESRDRKSHTPMHLAAKNGHETTVKLFFENGADVEPKDGNGRTPLCWAAVNGHDKVAEVLLGIAGVDPDLEDNKDRTPLSLAAGKGHEAVVRLLLSMKSVHPNARDKKGRTPISRAAKNGHEGVTRLLLATGGIYIESRDHSGRTPLSWAAGNGRDGVAKLLLENGTVDPSSKDNEGQSPLLWAARLGRQTTLNLLLRAHCDSLNARDGYGRTALSWAARNGQELVVKTLLAEPGVDVNASDFDGLTPLALAASEDHKNIVELLLKHDGIDKNAYEGLPRPQPDAGAAALSTSEKQISKRVGVETMMSPGGLGSSSGVGGGCVSSSQTSLDEPGASVGHNGEGFEKFRCHLVSIYTTGDQPAGTYDHKIVLKLEWEVHRAMQRHRKGTLFSSILTVTGNEIDAQAAACGDYLAEHFKTGETVLRALQSSWHSDSPYDTGPIDGDLRRLSVKLLGPESSTAVITAAGSSDAIIDVAYSLAWFCCAIRPNGPLGLGLSTFSFDFSGWGDQPHDDIVVELQCLDIRQGSSDKTSCWHGLFNSAVLVLNGPVYDRSRFRDPVGSQTDPANIPRGLDIPFNTMVHLAAVNYPFEYESGIILKGFNTLLVATGKWRDVAGDVTAIQWHFVEPTDQDSMLEISLSDYTGAEYHLWEPGKDPLPEFEIVRKTFRAFVGWSDSCKIELNQVDIQNVESTSLERARGQVALKFTSFSTAFGKAPFVVTANAALEIEPNTRKYDELEPFYKMLGRSVEVPVLLYAPDERRGWLVPRLSALECMARINIGKNGLSDNLPPKDGKDLQVTKKKLLDKLSDPNLKQFLAGYDESTTITNAFRLTELLYSLSQLLDWAEAKARYQHSLGKVLQGEKLYGLELYKVSLEDREHHVKVYPVERSHSGWARLLDSKAIKGVMFCKGLEEVISTNLECNTCRTLPRDNDFLAAVVSCLRYLIRHDCLPPSVSLNLQRSAFEGCDNCPSFEHRLHNMDTTQKVAASTSTTSPKDHLGGVVVFGKTIGKSKNKWPKIRGI